MNDDDIKRPMSGEDADEGDEEATDFEPSSIASGFMAELVAALRDSYETDEGRAHREFRDSIAEEARSAVEKYNALNLTSLDEVLRMRRQTSLEAKVQELVRAGTDVQLAERVAQESANLEAGKALRRLASEVVCDRLPVYLLVGASEAVYDQGEVWCVARPGIPIEVTYRGRPDLWGWLARCAAGASGLDRDGRPCDGESARWLAAVRVRADWPGEEPAQRPAWPWGAYTTPELEMIADAVREFWIRWDGETSSAPKNEVVICWLEGRGMSNNLAKATATIIRSPMVPAGQRPRRDSWA